MKGILFTPPMIKAIVDGKKCQTRRLMKPQPFMHNGVFRWQPRKGVDINLTDHPDLAIPFARYHVGETVYIKESWWSESGDIYYKSDWGNGLPVNMFYAGMKEGKWRSPLFMPAWAARSFCQITNVYPEKLQAITEADAIAEGAPCGYILASPTIFHKGLPNYTETPKDYRMGFQRLWDSINKEHPWSGNWWVWKYCFEKVRA